MSLLMEIKVFINRTAERPCFCRIVNYNSCVEFDFNLVLRSMRILYGSDCIVEFKVID